MDYPSSLPGPVKAGHSPRSGLSSTDLPGPELHVVRQVDYSGTLAVDFFFTAEQTETFFDWWRIDLEQGGSWFNCSWPALRPGLMACKFKEPPVLRHVYNGAHRVSATVQVRGATLPVRRLLRDAYRSETAVGNESYGYLKWAAMMEGTTQLEYFSDEVNQGLFWPSTSAPTLSDDAPFGSGSVQFAQARRLDIFVPAYTPMNHQTSKYTYDGWVKVTNFAGTISGYHTLLSDDTHSGGSTWNVILAITAAGGLYAVIKGNPSIGSANGLVIENHWHHVALTHDGAGTALRLWLDGVVVAESTPAVSSLNSPTRMSIGCQNSNFVGSFERPLLGRMKAWRLHVGKCLWPTADPFTPPSRLVDYTNARTVLDLTPVEGQLVDSSGYNSKTLALVNTATCMAETDPLIGGHYLDCPGPDGHATVAAHSDIAVGGADYCLELRVLCLGYPAVTRWAYDARTGSPQQAPAFELWASDSAMHAQVLGHYLNVTAEPFPLNQWVSLVLMRINGVYIFLQDGRTMGARFLPGLEPVPSTVYVGSSYTGAANTFWYGKVRRVRLTRGVPRYFAGQLAVSAFSSSKAEDASWEKTVFQLNMEGANNGSVFADQSAYKHSVSSVNSAWTVNSHSRFGYTSLSLPTTGYLSIGYSSKLNLQGQVFTAEGHLLNLGATANTYVLLDFAGTGPAGQGWSIRFDITARKLILYDGVTSAVVGQTPDNSINANLYWTHWAVVYDGVGTVLLVLDGVVRATVSYVVPATYTGGITFGRTGVAPAFTGRHGNVRIRLEALYPKAVEIPPWQDFSYLH